MKTSLPHGVFVLSIDVGGDSVATNSIEGVSISDSAATLDAAKWLLNVLDQQRMAATWFLAGPGTSLLRSHVLAAEVKHEIGLLVADPALHPGGRLAYSRNLERRLYAARAAGVEVQSLATRSVKRLEHLDLLVKHGIRTVRQGAARPQTQAHSSWSAVSTMRFGICNMPPNLNAIDRSWWQGWIASLGIRRQIALAAQRSQYCHFALDVQTLTTLTARKRLQAVLRAAGRRCDGVAFRATTVASLAASLMARPVAPHAQSILRAA